MTNRNEFISLYELGSHLNSNGHSYDLDIPISQSGLLDEIDLLRARGKINSVFYYEGIAKLTIFNPRELDQSKNTLSFSSVPVKGYFYDSDLDLLFKKPCENNYFKGIYEPFFMDQDVFDFLDLLPKDYLEGMNDNILDMKLIYELKIDKSKYVEKDLLFINYEKLRSIASTDMGTPTITQAEPENYKKYIAELEQQLADKEANASFMMGNPSVERGEPKNNEQLIKELAAAKAQIAELNEKVSGLTAENDDLKKQLSSAIDTPPNEIIDEGQGDTLLILGAVMECINEIAKPNYTQQYLIEVIKKKYKSTTSLSESTLKKKFPKAKKYLKQRHTP